MGILNSCGMVLKSMMNVGLMMVRCFVVLVDCGNKNSEYVYIERYAQDKVGQDRDRSRHRTVNSSK